MQAQITVTHTLCLEEWKGSSLQLPWSGKVPGTWISYLLDQLDHEGKLVPNGWSEVGFGPFRDSYLRAAYDHATGVLGAITPPVTLMPFEQLRWVP